MARVKGPSERYSKKQLIEMKVDLLRNLAKTWRIPVAAKKPTDLVRLVFKAQQAADGKQSSADRKTKDELHSNKRKKVPAVELEIDDDDSDIEIEEAPVAMKKKVVKKAAPVAKATKKAPPKAAKKSSKKVVEEEEDDEEEDQSLEEILQSWLPEVSVLLVKLADYADDTEVGPTIKKVAKLAQAGAEEDPDEEEDDSEEEEPDEDEEAEEDEEESDESEEDEEEDEEEKPAPKSKKKAKAAVVEEEEEDEEEDDSEEDGEITFDMKEVQEAKRPRLVEIGNYLNDNYEAEIDVTTKDMKALRGSIIATIKESGEVVREVEDDDEDKDGAGGAPDWLKKGTRGKVKYEGEWLTGKVTSVGEESVMFLFDVDDTEAEYDFEAVTPLKRKAKAS